jgi:hypothetical protein
MLVYLLSLCSMVAKVLDLSGASTDSRLSGLGRVQISTFCVRHDLMAAGGFAGELIVANLKKTGLQCRCLLTHTLSFSTSPYTQKYSYHTLTVKSQRIDWEWGLRLGCVLQQTSDHK